jgi:hypothetical protein
MGSVYIIREDGTTDIMKRVQCKDEESELQAILEKNLDLIPGDQIDPEDPRRWLLVKREMPVPDPSTGLNRWSIDFFIVDQDAVPTFVECKRSADIRSRREIIGQMLEYAANGHYYWTSDTIKNYAEQTASKNGLTIDEVLSELHPTNEESVEVFFDKVQDNLREGQLRLVFFMEDSPMELRSVVDFLNRQMERSEVLLVEAQQHELDQQRVVAPMLFGYTEQARQVKRTITIDHPKTTRRTWSRTSFIDEARKHLGEQTVKILETLYDQAQNIGYEIRWGTGIKEGSFNVKLPRICSRSIFTIWTNGRMSLNFGWLDGSEIADKARERFAELMIENVGITLESDYANKWPHLTYDEWAPRVADVIGVLKQLFEEFPEQED